MPQTTLRALAFESLHRTTYKGTLNAVDARRLIAACLRLETASVGVDGIEYEVNNQTGLIHMTPRPDDSAETEVGYGGYAYPAAEVRAAAASIAGAPEPHLLPGDYPPIGHGMCPRGYLLPPSGPLPPAALVGALVLSGAICSLLAWSMVPGLLLWALAGVVVAALLISRPPAP